MEKIDQTSVEALKWLRFVLNPDTTMPTVSDWSALMAFAEKQALIGIFLPEKCPENLPKDLLLQWIGQVQLIEQQNELLNKRIEQLFGMLEKDGFQCCLLKGQGNTSMYPNPLRRCPGDIDVWIDTDEQTVLKYVEERFPETTKSYKHVKFPVFNDVPVDVHTTPLKFYCPKYHKRLQRWIHENKKEQFEHIIHLKGIEKEIKVPTAKFNVIYQLGHMLIHLFDEGVGLRHFVDYFYVLKGLNLSEKEHGEIIDTLSNLGMMCFAKAVMWIESNILGLPVVYCIVTPDERRGKQLLVDVLDGGNFGKYSQRYKGKSGFYWRGIIEARRLFSLLSFAPCETAFCLFRKIKTAVRYICKA